MLIVCTAHVKRPPAHLQECVRHRVRSVQALQLGEAALVVLTTDDGFSVRSRVEPLLLSTPRAAALLRVASLFVFVVIIGSDARQIVVRS